MAAALRLQRLTRFLSLRRQLPSEQCRLSSTSQANPIRACPENPTPNRQPWSSWGFDDTDYLKDRYAAHCVFFSFITLFGFGWGLYFSYYPDFAEMDWAQREAFLLIREREAAGLPMIDKNYIPPEKVILPTDEELGDFEIVI